MGRGMFIGGITRGNGIQYIVCLCGRTFIRWRIRIMRAGSFKRGRPSCRMIASFDR